MNKANKSQEIKQQEHTPGPWTIGCDGNGDYIMCKNDGESYGDSVCEVYNSSEPDKKLIAAAPDLLEACKNMEYVLKRHGVWTGDHFYYNGRSASEFFRTMDLINGAIAKAEGKP